MLSDMLNKPTESPREMLFWIVLAAMILGQLAVFYALCNQQMRKAQARVAVSQAQRTAIADCMQYTAKATLSSCAARVIPIDRGTSASYTGTADAERVNYGATSHSVITTAMPVSFSLR